MIRNCAEWHWRMLLHLDHIGVRVCACRDGNMIWSKSTHLFGIAGNPSAAAAATNCCCWLFGIELAAALRCCRNGNAAEYPLAANMAAAVAAELADADKFPLFNCFKSISATRIGSVSAGVLMVFIHSIDNTYFHCRSRSHRNIWPFWRSKSPTMVEDCSTFVGPCSMECSGRSCPVRDLEFRSCVLGVDQAYKRGKQHMEVLYDMGFN